MQYKVVFFEKAKKQLSKLDIQTSALILGWLEKNIQNCDNPKIYEKELVEDKSGQYKYKVGDYRLVCEIKNDEVIVLALTVGNRSEIYKHYLCN